MELYLCTEKKDKELRGSVYVQKRVYRIAELCLCTEKYTDLRSSFCLEKRVYKITELCLCTEQSIQNYGALF